MKQFMKKIHGKRAENHSNTHQDKGGTLFPNIKWEDVDNRNSFFKEIQDGCLVIVYMVIACIVIADMVRQVTTVMAIIDMDISGMVITDMANIYVVRDNISDDDHVSYDCSPDQGRPYQG
jgi:hypothetical protein